MVLDGRLERGRFGVAGEFGHQIILPGGHRCECGNRGCWEQYASGNALGREARELAAANSPVAQELLKAVDGHVESITGVIVTELAKAGDPTSRELLEDVGEWLGRGSPIWRRTGSGHVRDRRRALRGRRPAGGAGPEGFRRNLTGRGFRPAAEIELAALGQRGPDRRRGPVPGQQPDAANGLAALAAVQMRAPSSCSSFSPGSFMIR